MCAHRRETTGTAQHAAGVDARSVRGHLDRAEPLVNPTREGSGCVVFGLGSALRRPPTVGIGEAAPW